MVRSFYWVIFFITIIPVQLYATVIENALLLHWLSPLNCLCSTYSPPHPRLVINKTCLAGYSWWNLFHPMRSLNKCRSFSTVSLFNRVFVLFGLCSPLTASNSFFTLLFRCNLKLCHISLRYLFICCSLMADRRGSNVKKIKKEILSLNIKSYYTVKETLEHG